MRSSIEFSNRFRILKGGKISLVVSALLGSVTLSFAAPSGGSVVSGNATISQNGKTTNINQSTQKASINWNKFSIASDETVNFNQPNVNSITLNRVIGNERSIINGALNANGQVWILNSNGVLFGANAKINTSGLLATTKDISDTNFQNSNYTFTGNSTNSVINQGTITVQNNGYVVLASNEVRNSGTIEAIKGKVHLTGANEYTINLNGNSLVDLTVDKGVLDALVENSGTILSDGGEIYLTTNAVNELLRGVVNNTGVIEANSMEGVTGKVELFAHGGEVQIAGTIKAKDGFVETSGKDFTLLDEAVIQTAHWLIDPVDITIDSALASTIETALGVGDVTIETTTPANSTVDTSGNQTSSDGDTTNGDIYVNSAIAWSNNILTLKADNDININSQLDLTNTAGLFLQYAQTTNTGTYNVNAPVNIASTGSFSTQHASDAKIDWTIVNDISAVQSMSLTGNTVLGSDISASTIANFDPIGDVSTRFTGTFDGLGHTITGLTINRSTENYVGLFGFTESGSTIQNVGLTNINIIGHSTIGGLVGYNKGTITNSYASGNVTGKSISVSDEFGTYLDKSMAVGGLVGNNYYGTIINSYATGSVSGTGAYTGGLTGQNYYGTIKNSYASGSVTGIVDVGGLVGHNWGAIRNAYASGSVIGANNVGGLVGVNSGSIINAFYDNETNKASMTDSSLGRTKAQIRTLITGGLWSLTRDTTVEGYQVVLLPYLSGITRSEDIQTAILFESGYGDSSNPYTITTWEQLQNINFNSDTLTNNYYYNLSNDLSSTTTGYDTYASSSANSSAGWNPIGDNPTKFTGTFDGLGHTISDLYINRPTESFLGLFGFIDNSSTIKNIGLEYVNITGLNYVGGLVGANTGAITNSYATGSVSGGAVIGGLVGYNNGNITNAYVTGNVSGNQYVGGLVGETHGSITNTYTTGSVSGGSDIGGLVGIKYAGNITNSYSTARVTGISYFTGGLVGSNDGGTITNAYATGSVTGNGQYVGGLLGFNSGSISNSFWDSSSTGQPSAIGTDNNSQTATDIASAPYDIATYSDPTTGFGTDIEESSTISSSYKYPVLSVFNGGGTTTWKIYKAPTVTSSNAISSETQTQINRIITAIVNRKVLTNTDLNTLMNSGIDLGSFLNEVKLAGGNLVLIPGIVLKVLNGGINLPYGLDRQFSLDNTNNNNNEEEERI